MIKNTIKTMNNIDYYKNITFTDMERLRVIEWLERKLYLDLDLEDDKEDHIKHLCYELISEMERDGTIPKDY